LEPEVYVMEKRLKLRDDEKILWLVNPSKCANRHLLDYWLQIPELPLNTSVFWRFIGHLVRQASVTGVPKLDRGKYPLGKTLIEWGDRRPILNLTEEDRNRGIEWLDEKGMDVTRPVVAFHCRGSDYDFRKHGKSSRTTNYHQHRNVDVTTYHDAIDFLIDEGFNVIRLKGGEDVPERRHLLQMDRHDCVPEWMDIFVLGSATFLVGSDSGPLNVANAFGTPVLGTNMIPIGNALSFRNRDVSVPRLYRNRFTGKLFSFREILNLDISSFTNSKQYFQKEENEGIQIVPNSADELREAVKDMLEKVQYDRDVDWLPEEGWAKQVEFRRLLQPCHVSYGGQGFIAPSFLKKYENLLGVCRT